jgi:hypothetical protein
MPTETAALAIIETITTTDLFKPEVINPLLAKIADEVRAQASTLDTSTPFNRSELKALAFKVGKTKTYAESARLELVSGEKKKLAAIDARGKETKDYLQALQDEVRKPLTDWEDDEKKRVADHEAALLHIAGIGDTNAGDTTAGIDLRILMLKDFQNRDWQEFAKRAQDTINSALHSLYNGMGAARKREEEAAELARLRAESAAREQKEREERIAREATERQAQAAKDAAKAEKERAAAKKAAAAEEEKRRAESTRIRNRVHGEIKLSLVSHGVSIEHSEMLVALLCDDAIPHVSITY